MSLKRKMKRAAASEQMPLTKKVADFEVSFSPIRDEWHDRVSKEALSAIADLYCMSRQEPERAIPILEAWIQEEPDALAFHNFLFVAHMNAGNETRAEEVLVETLRLHPDYLFARLSMVELLLGRGDPQGFQKVFGEAQSLREVYPRRKRFHVSEFTAFYALRGRSRLEMGDRAGAEAVYDLLHAVAPGEAPTRMLGRALASPLGLLGRLMALVGRR